MWEPAVFLIVVGLAVWFWTESLKARERAVDEGTEACRRNRLQFLDETVECISLRPARNEHGQLALRRIYRFEFSDDGVNRRAGRIVMLGSERESVYLEPYLVADNR
jgi:hypothetical protein